MSQKTIAAIATPIGNGALGVIRISGEFAIEIADKVFRSFSDKKLSDLQGYSACYGVIADGENILDDVVALVFKEPHSFTGEDTVEFSVHGGSVMLRSILRLILKNGAFLAEAGEFTKRAFLNGKTDLTRAESIMGLISAQSESELRLSRVAHSGKISRKISIILSDLVSLDASIAAFSDYPDEDIEGLELNSFKFMLEKNIEELKRILIDYDAGKIIREGIDAVIVGKPNVGKSTLMNMLSQKERSIVTEIAGTTRDVIEETVLIGDITVRLSDTAGIHKTNDVVESIGVKRAKEKIDSAQLILAVFDATENLDSDDMYLLKTLPKKNTLIIINKTDMETKINLLDFKHFNTVEISAKEGTGYQQLCKTIQDICNVSYLTPESTVLISERQRACAERAYEGLREALKSLCEGVTIDAVGICIDDALSALLELTGQRVTNEVTDEIFKHFCVGK